MHRTTTFLFVVASVLVCFGCKSKSSTPTAPNEIVSRIDTLDLTYDSPYTIGGPGFYGKAITIVNNHFDPLWGDSVVKMLLDSNMNLVEYWYPATCGIARNPYVGMCEIARLNQPDTTIYRFGHAPLDTMKLTQYSLVRQWRHYRIVR